MLDKLVDKLFDIIGLAQVWTVVYDYQQAVVFRFGKVNRVLGPGIHFIWPCYMEVVQAENIIKDVRVLAPQSITTCDHVSCVIKAVVLWRITDVTSFFTKVEGGEEALAAIIATDIEWLVSQTHWENVLSEQFGEDIEQYSRLRLAEFGVELISIGFESRTKARSLRFWGFTD